MSTFKARSLALMASAAMITSMAGLGFAVPAIASSEDSLSDFDRQVLEATGLTEEEMRDFAEKDAKAMEETMQDIFSTVGESREVSPKKGEPGEIWVDTSSSSSGGFFYLGHAAIVSNKPGYAIESYSKEKSPIGEDGVRHYDNDWKYKGCRKVLLGNKKSSRNKRVGAAAFAERQVGKPYNINFWNKFDTNSYYCSQLVWRAWLSQGNDIDASPYDTIVTPRDIVESPETVTLWRSNG